MRLKLDENLGHMPTDLFGQPDMTWRRSLAKALPGAWTRTSSRSANGNNEAL